MHARNLLSCITARFNVGALHVFNVGRMVLVMTCRDFDVVLLRALNSKLETLTVEGFRVIKISE